MCSNKHYIYKAYTCIQNTIQWLNKKIIENKHQRSSGCLASELTMHDLSEDKQNHLNRVQARGDRPGSWLNKATCYNPNKASRERSETILFIRKTLPSKIVRVFKWNFLSAPADQCNIGMTLFRAGIDGSATGDGLQNTKGNGYACAGIESVCSICSLDSTTVYNAHTSSTPRFILISICKSWINPSGSRL